MPCCRLRCPNVTNSATQLVAAAITPRPCGPRNRAVMIVMIIAPMIQYALATLVKVMAFQDRMGWKLTVDGWRLTVESAPCQLPTANCQPSTHVILSAMTVRFLRWLFRWWPFMHGRGWILRLARLLLGRGAVRFDIGGGTLIEGSLDEYMGIWAFMREHERDAPFQHSLDLLRHGQVAFDVGANLGIWSLLAARRG